ncbi:MAG: hypothetical protein WAU32_15400 [Thermoanaerobaculia bacterium]
MSPLGYALVGVAGAFALGLVLPRLLLRRAQDRLASRLLADATAPFDLLTRAELFVGPHRRLPGVLGLGGGALVFESLFGESTTLPTQRIQKIVTGDRLANGRRLFRLEVLRLTRSNGEDLEFILAPASAAAWRSHLGLWAVKERKAATDVVTPGRR